MRVLVLSHRDVLAALPPQAHAEEMAAEAAATVAASALFCDSRESLRNEAGEFRLAVTEGLISGDEHVRAELGEVLMEQGIGPEVEL